MRINSYKLFTDAIGTQAVFLKIKLDYSYPAYQSVVGMLFIIVFLKQLVYICNFFHGKLGDSKKKKNK